MFGLFLIEICNLCKKLVQKKQIGKPVRLTYLLFIGGKKCLTYLDLQIHLFSPKVRTLVAEFVATTL